MKIIFLTHWFPPYNEIGAVRPYEMVKFLCNNGFNVKVVTSSGAGSAENYLVDVSNIEICRVEIPKIVKYANKPNASIFGQIIKRIFYPDQYITMRRKIFEMAKGLFADGPDLVISSGLPFSTHVVGKELSAYFDVPWIADNRDLWANTPYRRSFFGSHFFDLYYERRVLCDSDSLIVIGEGMAADLGGRLPGKNVHIVMNGADCGAKECFFDDYKGRVNFLYTGTLYKGKRDLSPLMKALSNIDIKCEVNFFGAENFYVDRLAKSFQKLNIIFNDKVGKSQIKEIQKNANFLILALGTDVFEKNVLTGKFFEYLETGRPVIAICDEDSELGRLISKYRLGCASRSPEVIAKFIVDVVDRGVWRGGVPVELTREYQFKATLPKLIENLFKNS